MAGYFGLLAGDFHDYLFWFHYQAGGWRGRLDWAGHELRVLTWTVPATSRYVLFNVIVVATVVVLAVGIGLMIAARTPLPVSLYTTLAVLAFAMADTTGKPRFAWTALGIFTGVSARLPRWLFWALVAACAGLLAFLRMVAAPGHCARTVTNYEGERFTAFLDIAEHSLNAATAGCRRAMTGRRASRVPSTASWRVRAVPEASRRPIISDRLTGVPAAVMPITGPGPTHAWISPSSPLRNRWQRTPLVARPLAGTRRTASPSRSPPPSLAALLTAPRP